MFNVGDRDHIACSLAGDEDLPFRIALRQLPVPALGNLRGTDIRHQARPWAGGRMRDASRVDHCPRYIRPLAMTIAVKNRSHGRLPQIAMEYVSLLDFLRPATT